MFFKNKKQTTRHIHKILSCVTLLALLFCAAGCSKKTPKEALEEAYEKTFVTGSPIELLLGLTELNTQLEEHGAHSRGFSLSLQELSGEGFDESAGLLSGLGITVDTASDLRNRRGSATMDITYGGTTYLTVDGHLNGSKLHLAVPRLLEGNLFIDLSTLEEDLASDSMIARTLAQSGITLPENFSAGLLDPSSPTLAPAQLDALLSAREDLEDAILVEKVKKNSVSLPSGVSAKKIYAVTVPADAYGDFLNTAMESVTDYTDSLANALGGTVSEDLNSEEFRSLVDTLTDSVGDILLHVAVNKKGYITYVESVVESETDQITLTATFTGDKNPPTNAEVILEADIDGELMALTYEQSFDTVTNLLTFSTALDYEGETLLDISGEGEFTDIEKGKKYTFDLNYLEFDLAGMFYVSLSGNYYVDTTTCTVTTPSGPEYGLLTMDQKEFLGLVLEIAGNIQNDPLLSELTGSLNY